MATLLSCQALAKSFSTRPLFEGISIGIEDGDRIGLIGPNGSGKSTLLKILAGRETPDSGAVSSRRGLPVGYVPQEESFAPGVTVTQILTDALAHEPLDEGERTRRVEMMLARIGFASGEEAAATLSGGWQKRLSIARAVIGDPEVLLLDEPTNHLDLEGVLWLETFLQSAPFAYLLISHDRYFLENVARRIIELNPAYAGGFLGSEGAYSDFLVKREEYFASQAQQERALAGVVRREIEWLRRGAKARTTKAKGRIDQAGRLIDDLGELKYRNNQAGNAIAGLGFTESGRQTKELLAAKSVEKSLGGKKLFADLTVMLSPKRRLGIVGRNGSGKTTLLRLLAGEIEPDAGTLRRADRLRVVWFDQNRTTLNRDETLRDALCPNGDTVEYRGGSMHVSGWAKRFLFRSDQLTQTVGSLSGGEQARVLIARLMLQPADLLILDEPTNDLDIPSLEVLEESLADFPGAVVLVTHDRYLLDRVSTEILGLAGDGTARHFADYEQWEESRVTAAPPAAKAAVAATAPAAAVLPPARSSLSAAERRELARIEAKIEEAEGTVTNGERALEDPAVTSDAARLQQAWDSLAAAREAVTLLYARWQELEERQN